MEYKQTSFFEYVENNRLKRDALDEFFAQTGNYRNGRAYLELLQFISRFTQYSPYNCFLLHLQNPQLTQVATPNQWLKVHNRRIKADARPLIIIAPMRPVLFVYDLTDTEGTELPDSLIDSGIADAKISDRIWRKTYTKTLDDNIAVVYKDLSPDQPGGAVCHENPIKYLSHDGEDYHSKYAIELNYNLPLTSRYASLVHELGRIYSGHMGCDEGFDWPNRGTTPDAEKELEAKSISYLVCSRRDIPSRSDEYLAGLAEQDIELPAFSLQSVLRVANRIEMMGGRSAK
jgi:hypothetical protein